MMNLYIISSNKISVRILFPFVLTGIITERKDNWQENIQTLIKEHIDLKRCEYKKEGNKYAHIKIKKQKA